jgi:hypothetical protein
MKLSVWLLRDENDNDGDYDDASKYDDDDEDCRSTTDQEVRTINSANLTLCLVSWWWYVAGHKVVATSIDK